MSRRSSSFVSFLCWLPAALVTAVLSHAALSLAACFAAAPEYATHAHAAVVPAAAIALCAGAGLLLTVVLRALGKRHERDPLLLLAAHYGAMRPFVPVALVALGGFASLVSMEFFEQWRAFGRVTGVVDALDGNVVLGIVVVAAIASIVGYLGLRCARFFIARVAAIVDEIVAWLGPGHTLAPSAVRLRTGSRFCWNRYCAHCAHCLGLRAPPLLLV